MASVRCCPPNTGRRGPAMTRVQGSCRVGWCKGGARVVQGRCKGGARVVQGSCGRTRRNSPTSRGTAAECAGRAPRAAHVAGGGRSSSLTWLEIFSFPSGTALARPEPGENQVLRDARRLRGAWPCSFLAERLRTFSTISDRCSSRPRVPRPDRRQAARRRRRRGGRGRGRGRGRGGRICSTSSRHRRPQPSEQPQAPLQVAAPTDCGRVRAPWTRCCRRKAPRAVGTRPRRRTAAAVTIMAIMAAASATCCKASATNREPARSPPMRTARPPPRSARRTGRRSH